MTLTEFQCLADAFERGGKKVLWGNLTRGLIRYSLRGRLRTAWV